MNDYLTKIFERFSAEYDTFWIDSEIPSYYKLHVTGYSGDAGDSLSPSNVGLKVANGRSFSTTDKDHDTWSSKIFNHLFYFKNY